MLSQKAHKLPLVSVDSVSASTMLGRSLVHAGQAVVGAPGPAKQAEETGAHTRTSPHRSVVVEYTIMLLTHCLPSLMDRTIVGAARVAKACPIRGHGVGQLLFHRSHAARTHGTPLVNSVPCQCAGQGSVVVAARLLTGTQGHSGGQSGRQRATPPCGTSVDTTHAAAHHEKSETISTSQAPSPPNLPYLRTLWGHQTAQRAWHQKSSDVCTWHNNNNNEHVRDTAKPHMPHHTHAPIDIRVATLGCACHCKVL